MTTTLLWQLDKHFFCKEKLPLFTKADAPMNLCTYFGRNKPNAHLCVRDV